MISVPDISQVYPKESLTLDSRFVVGEGNARDLSSDANTGTIVSGRALSLDGTGDHLDGGTIAAHAFTGSFTVSLWAKTSSATEQTFAMKFSGGSTGYQVTLRADQNPAYWQCSVGDDAGWQHARIYESQLSATFDDGAWRHIVLRANNGTLEGYVNGVIGTDTDTYNNSVALGTSGQRFTIGGNYASTPTKLVTGSMCGLKIWNVALSAAQIAEQYNNPEQVLPTGASAANLISYWPLHDYDNTSPNSLDGLYFMDLGTAKSNAKASNCGMDRKEGVPCPQLGLMPSISRRWFDGTNDYYTGGLGIDFEGTGGTISAWVIPMADTSLAIFETSEGEGPRHNLSISASEKFSMTRYDTTAGDYFGKTYAHGSSLVGQLWHVVGVYDGSGSAASDITLYVNGSAEDDTPYQISGSTGINETNIGARYVGGGSPSWMYSGYILNVAVWTDALSAAEVTEIYNGGTGFDPQTNTGNYASAGDLAHYWLLNNSHTVQDLKGSKNLTRVGGTELSVIPEGTTAGTTLFGNTEENRADNAVINLDGHSYVSIPHDVNLNPDMSEGFTVSVWAKMRNLGNGASTPILDKDSGADRWYLRIRDDASDAIQFNFGDGSGSSDVGYGNLADNDWHHYVFVLNTSGSAWTTARHYRDGAHISSADADISARNADTPGTDALTIGSTGTTAAWDGAIAYPKIYARSLSENEVKLLYSSRLRVVGGL